MEALGQAGNQHVLQRGAQAIAISHVWMLASVNPRSAQGPQLSWVVVFKRREAATTTTR